MLVGDIFHYFYMSSDSFVLFGEGIYYQLFEKLGAALIVGREERV